MNKGYIALISILIISAIVVLIATSFSLISISESDLSLTENQSWKSFYLASACAEEALQKIKESASFEGSSNLSFGGDSCGYQVIKLADENRLILASSTINGMIKKVRITLDKISPINITSWQQVADF